jgi:hypothetical protein
MKMNRTVANKKKSILRTAIFMRSVAPVGEQSKPLLRNLIEILFRPGPSE